MGEIGAWIIAALGLLSTAIGIAMQIHNYTRNVRGDAAKTSREDGEILTRLGYIQANIDSILRKLEQQEAKNLEFEKNITTIKGVMDMLDLKIQTINENIGKVEARVDHIEGRMKEGSGN